VESHGVPQSPLYGDYIGSPSGLLGTLETLGDLGDWKDWCYIGLICKDSLGTPQRLLEDSLGLPGTPWDSLGTLQQRWSV